MEIQIISIERIKPSSPTPPHLRNYKLCLLDQLIPATYAPIVIFYPNNQDSTTPPQVLEKLAHLKKSLSETITRFFPLAGTIIDDLAIDCNDQGASFTTTKIKVRMSQYLTSPDLKLLARFLPCGLTSTGLPVTNIQANEFECGGIAIGVCISHKILDGTALSTFLKSWSSSSSNQETLESRILPDFSAPSLFPAEDLWLKNASIPMWGSLFEQGQFVTKRFVFDGPSIASLKETANDIIRATRVEIVSGFIWKHAMAASEERYGSRKPSLLTHVVNLRRRANPNFPGNSIGNLIWIASSKLSENDDLDNLRFLVDEVRKSISKIDGEYVEKLRSDEGAKMMKEHLKEIEEFGSNQEDVHHFSFRSWCNLGLYHVDFGWGKPIWVTSIDASGPTFMNLAVLIDANCGRGIEAWVTMDEQEMSILERDQQFRAFASLDPSPLNI